MKEWHISVGIRDSEAAAVNDTMCNISCQHLHWKMSTKTRHCICTMGCLCKHKSHDWPYPPYNQENWA